MPTTKLYHAQVCEYARHRGKLTALRNGALDPHSPTPLTSTVWPPSSRRPDDCPHELFRREDGARGSRLSKSFLKPDVQVTERTNATTHTAALVLPSVGCNHQRHGELQRLCTSKIIPPQVTATTR